MSFVAEILQRKTANQNAPCPACGSPFRWLDIYGVTRCKHCHKPPTRLFVQRIEVLAWQDDPARAEWHTTWEAPVRDADDRPFYDPFAGRLPPGSFFPFGNRTEFGCRHAETTSVPCRGGEWIRIECARCGRPIDIVDAI